MRNAPILAALATALALGCLLGSSAVAQDVPRDHLQPDVAQTPEDAEKGANKGVNEDVKNKDAKPDAPDASASRKRADAPPKDPQDRDSMLVELYAHLAQSRDATQAAPIAKTIERLWTFTESPTIGVLMNRAGEAVAADRNELALKLLDAVVDLSPDYAEGWSRRAYVYYMLNDYDRAAGDLRRTLALEPNHFKALDGLARILRESGQKKSALMVYRQLLRIYPFMPGAKEAADALSVEVEGQGI
jgi:tetratricopeptide (TPR) repeat protein